VYNWLTFLITAFYVLKVFISLFYLQPDRLLPEEGSELSAQREARKLHDAEWAEIVNILAGAATIEPIVINVAAKPPDDVENGTFVARSRNDIFEDALSNITSE